MKNFADPNTGLTAFPTLLIPVGGMHEGELWKEALVIDPKYQPAADSIRTVEETLSLQGQLQQLSP